VPILFIAGIELLRIDAELCRGERVGDLFFLTNDRAHVRGLLSERFTATVGALEAESLTSGLAVAYSVEDREFADDAAAIDWLKIRLAYVAHFLHYLWFVRDNAAYLELGFVEEQRRGRRNVHRTFFGGVYTEATGARNVATFSRDDLRVARDMFRRYIPANVVVSPQSLVEQVGRWARAHYFVQAAPSTSDLGIKIANYCTAFEALASTDIQELSHKLAERIACLLEPAGEARMQLFRDVKAAYSLRSKVVHGGRGEANLRERVERAAIACDQIARRLLRNILDDEALHERFILGRAEKTMEDYFLALVLS
jgi:hypothetical protein